MKIISRLTFVFLLAAVPLFAAARVSAQEAAEKKPVELKAGNLKFKIPAGWEPRKEPRMMSAGGFTTKGKNGGEGIEADFYHFGAGGGGGVEANVKRWQGQFQPGADGKLPEVKREEWTFGEGKALLVEIKGTFLSGPVMAPNKTPKPGYAMLGVIVGDSGGDVFVKITGPEAEIAAVREDVKKLVASAFGK